MEHEKCHRLHRRVEKSGYLRMSLKPFYCITSQFFKYDHYPERNREILYSNEIKNLQEFRYLSCIVGSGLLRKK